MNPPARPNAEFADDLVMGAGSIGAMLGINRRQVYYLCRRSTAPIFRIGATLCVRRSTLTSWFAEQERTAVAQSLRP